MARDQLSRTLFSVDETTMAATVGKYFLDRVGVAKVTSRNLRTCDVIRKIR